MCIGGWIVIIRTEPNHATNKTTHHTDLILNRRQRLTDPAAIADAQLSLKRVSHGCACPGMSPRRLVATAVQSTPNQYNATSPHRTAPQMLSDFIDDTAKGMSKADKAKAVANMDISVVSEQYDKEIRNAVRNVFSGAFCRVRGVDECGVSEIGVLFCYADPLGPSSHGHHTAPTNQPHPPIHPPTHLGDGGAIGRVRPGLPFLLLLPLLLTTTTRCCSCS